jgi:hypothetical protein
LKAELVEPAKAFCRSLNAKRVDGVSTHPLPRFALCRSFGMAVACT